MEQYIQKSALVVEIERRKEEEVNYDENGGFASWADHNHYSTLDSIQDFLNTLEVKEVDNFLTPFISFKDMVNIQYPSVNDGIKAHAEIYSFNIESELFNQLTPEQQKLWRKEIEQAYISGGDAGVELARDLRYKENLEVKEVDLDKEIEEQCKKVNQLAVGKELRNICRYFFELGLKAQKGEKV